jgi:hypothetical protein
VTATLRGISVRTVPQATFEIVETLGVRREERVPPFRGPELDPGVHAHQHDLVLDPRERPESFRDQ